MWLINASILWLKSVVWMILMLYSNICIWQEKLDRNKAKCVEKMQNNVAEIHRTAEEKRAMIEANRGEEFLEIEEKAAKFRTRGYSPKKYLPCFGS